MDNLKIVIKYFILVTAITQYLYIPQTQHCTTFQFANFIQYDMPSANAQSEQSEFQSSKLPFVAKVIYYIAMISCFILKIILVLTAFEKGCLWALLVLIVPAGEILYILTMNKEDRGAFLTWYIGNYITLIASLFIPF